MSRSDNDESAAKRLFGRLTAGDALAGAVRAVSDVGAEVTGLARRSVRGAVESLELPTVRDYAAVDRRMADLEEEMFRLRDAVNALGAKMDRLLNALGVAEPAAKPAKPRTKKSDAAP